MSKTAATINFAASATTTVTPAAGPSRTYALPALDASNVSLTIVNGCGGPIFVQLGTVANLRAGPDVHNSMMIRPGSTVLLTTGNQGTATFAAIAASSGGSITFTRGTASAPTAFETRDDAVVV